MKKQNFEQPLLQSSVTWSFRNHLISWFGAEEASFIIWMLKTVVLLNNFVTTDLEYVMFTDQTNYLKCIDLAWLEFNVLGEKSNKCFMSLQITISASLYDSKQYVEANEIEPSLVSTLKSKHSSCELACARGHLLWAGEEVVALAISFSHIGNWSTRKGNAAWLKE